MQIGTASPKTKQLSRVEYDTPFPAVTPDNGHKPGVIALEKVKELFKNHKKLLDELENKKKPLIVSKILNPSLWKKMQHSFPKQTPFSVNITASVKEFSNDLSILRQQQMMEE
ncbi:hypothetical protein HK099_005889 [Clydaea vesicula]|uniref:Uncharacterized protein n=1 Tax=Clydaea vesicula TaxID=447962 RepID=A0AAD5XYL3_9FUNG|nr:hypothetical protein HK099_005889 [Clydaea vesicula]